MAVTTLAGFQITTAGSRSFGESQRENLSSKKGILSFTVPSARRSYFKLSSTSRIACLNPASSSPNTPTDLSTKVSESIGKAQETCADDPQSGECVAAWDEVEELSAAASHARDNIKASSSGPSDPLEEFCKDNMDTAECRTYDD